MYSSANDLGVNTTRNRFKFYGVFKSRTYPPWLVVTSILQGFASGRYAIKQAYPIKHPCFTSCTCPINYIVPAKLLSYAIVVESDSHGKNHKAHVHDRYKHIKKE